MKQTYFLVHRAGHSDDYDCRALSAILDLDREFLREYITFLVDEVKTRKRTGLIRGDESKDFSILWRRPDYEEIMGDAFQLLFDTQNREQGLFVGEFCEVLFGHGRPDKVSTDVLEHQVNVLKQLITKRSADSDLMRFIFRVAAGFPEKRWRELLAHFLAHNTNADDFEWLPLEPICEAWTGSALPFYQRKLDFMESLLALVQGLAFLDHRQHLERRIENLRKEIEVTKRREFMEDF